MVSTDMNDGSNANQNKKQDIKNKNIQIVTTNHQFLVDQNITASNLIGQHQADHGGPIMAKRNNGLIHVNDQSQEQTDDAASALTNNDQLTAGDEANLTHLSGALMHASGTSEYTGASIPSVGPQVGAQTQHYRV